MTMMRNFVGLLALALTEQQRVGCFAQNNVPPGPATVYESTELSPQNMDYDTENNMFVAHPGWYNDRLVHYYKFRMYTPGTYPDLIATGSKSADIPIQNVYIMTTTGGLDGAVGNPIIEYHHASGNNYSDFMEIQFVTIGADYVENSARSVADIVAMVEGSNGGSTTIGSGIIVNMPVVPTGATLQDSTGDSQTSTAPISPVTVFYEGTEVHTYVFETNEQSAADFFAFTRTENAQTDPSWSITVTPFADPTLVKSIPIWHVNQYSRGVEQGVNNRGPDTAGMRNLINLFRGDPGYSPLGQVFWMTELPMNYIADDATNAPLQMTEANGFATFATSMYVNCPGIGPITTPEEKTTTTRPTFETEIHSYQPTNVISGSPRPFLNGGNVEFQTPDGSVIGQTTTNTMGAYEYGLGSDSIPEGTTEISVVVYDNDGVALDNGFRRIPVASNYLDTAPPTVYEATDVSPQNMDFDRNNNRFTAHSGWYNDRLIHYYKFRMYTPGTYPGLINMGSTSSDVPTQALYIVTNDGVFTGAMGNPIIEYHHSDGNVYSDFMEIHFVMAPDGYAENTFRSAQDVASSGADVVPTGIVVNLPVVPTGATLQDPHTGGDALILPTTVWYRGVEVQTFVFEVNELEAADYFAPTRIDPLDGAFNITVTQFSGDDFLHAVPIWHLNQYSRGVIEGENGGGPSPAGMRNVIKLDRGDPGYSPLWQVYWTTELPINYLADQASNAATMTEENGFSFVVSPMFVNCPGVGDVGASLNGHKAEIFQTEIDFATGEPSYYVMGSPVPFLATSADIQTREGVLLGTVDTTTMGSYEYDVMMADLSAAPDGTSDIRVVVGDSIRDVATAGEWPEGTTMPAVSSDEHDDGDGEDDHDDGDDHDDNIDHDNHDDDHNNHDDGDELEPTGPPPSGAVAFHKNSFTRLIAAAATTSSLILLLS